MKNKLNNDKFSVLRIILFILIFLFVVFCFINLILYYTYKNVVLPNSYIDELKISNYSYEEVKKKIKEKDLITQFNEVKTIMENTIKLSFIDDVLTKRISRLVLGIVEALISITISSKGPSIFKSPLAITVP